MQRLVSGGPLGIHSDIFGPVLHDGHDQRGDPFRFRAPQHGGDLRRDILVAQNARRHRVLDIVVHIGDMIRKADNAPLPRSGPLTACVSDDAVEHLPRQVEAAAILSSFVTTRTLCS